MLQSFLSENPNVTPRCLFLQLFGHIVMLLRGGGIVASLAQICGWCTFLTGHTGQWPAATPMEFSEMRNSIPETIEWRQPQKASWTSFRPCLLPGNVGGEKLPLAALCGLCTGPCPPGMCRCVIGKLGLRPTETDTLLGGGPSGWPQLPLLPPKLQESTRRGTEGRAGGMPSSL